ncbi:MAG TPA: ATP-binding cassette domain-containing protein [Chitinophagaceae bacterium]|nr:ATP-binding cassette domain-containing protein [Chitinophagaceae bacterium]
MSIVVESLTKEFGVQKAVNDISFTIEKGNIVGFLGPNGAGKSTTMKMLTTYIPPTSGNAWVNGHNIIEDPMSVRKSVGYLPEKNPLYEDMNVREYLEFCARIHQLGKLKKERVEEMIELTQLEKEIKKKIGALSKGYKQRVGLAQAMIHHPEVLILDEPTSGLDPNQIRDIRDLIVNIGKSRTVLLSTHIMQEVQAMCNRVIIINNGGIVVDQDIKELSETHQKLNVLLVHFDKKPTSEFWKSFEHMNKYERQKSNLQYRLTGKNLQLLRQELMQHAVKHQLNIEHLANETQSLEDIFESYTK